MGEIRRCLMKEIDAGLVTSEVRRLVMEANYHLPKDVADALRKSKENEKWLLATDTLGRIIENS